MGQPNASGNWQGSQHLPRAISIAAFLIFFSLASHTAISKAPTVDEGMHMLRGNALWQTGVTAVQDENPPLAHWLIGSLFATEASDPNVTQLPSWVTLARDRLVREFLWYSGADVARLTFLARLPIIFSVLLLGALLARWSFQHTGLIGLTIVMTLFALSPNLIAHASLATTDAVATITIVAAILLVWYFWEKPSVGRWLLASLILGMALSSKITALALLPITLVLSYVAGRGRRWWEPGAIWLSFLPLATLVLWVIYGFEIGRPDGLSFSLPAPTYIANVVRVQKHISHGHYAFFLGEWSNHGWWPYFAVAYLIKTPAVTLLLLLIALVYLTWRSAWWRTIYLWLPAMTFFALASYSRLNIGYRHILPLVPLTWLLIAESASTWRRQRRLLPFLMALLLLYAFIGLLQRPHYLAYFNEFVGGSSQGHRYLGDSNLDWGQDLNLLAGYVAENDATDLYVSYFGAGDPTYYGIKQTPLFDQDGVPQGFSPANPAPGRYAISVNHLHGAHVKEPHLFDWFRRQEPIDNLGYSIMIFDVDESLSGSWMAHCYEPDPFPDETTAEQWVGGEGLRHVYFDCRTSWVLPAGDEPGWYVLPYELDLTPVKSHLPGELRLAYRHLKGPVSPAYEIHHWSGTDNSVRNLADNSDPVTLTDGTPVHLPAAADHVADFLGGWSTGSTWASVWQVLTGTDELLSVIMHLYTGKPTPTVGDGLGYSTVQWQPGDIFVQYHQFPDLPSQYLETGLYRHPSIEHLPFQVGERTEKVIQIHLGTQ